jgi:hypothetical protein
MNIKLKPIEVKEILDIITDCKEYNSEIDDLWEKISKQYYDEIEKGVIHNV